MVSKNNFTSFLKKISLSSDKKFLSYCTELIEQVHGLLDKGLARTASDKMKEIIDLCDQKNKNTDKSYAWIYGMANCLYAYSFCRFGRNVDDNYLEIAESHANNNNFDDIKFWVNLCKLSHKVNTGRTAHLDSVKNILLDIINNVENSSQFKMFLLSQLSQEALIHGEISTARQHAEELLNIAEDVNSKNFIVCAKTTLGKICFDSQKEDEALIFLKSAVSIGNENKCEQLICALFSIAETYFQKNNILDAKKYCDEAKWSLENSLELIDTSYHIHLHRNLALLAQKENQLELAIDHFNHAIKIAQKRENPLEEGVSQLMLGKFFITINKMEKATIAIEEACGKFIIINNKHLLANAKKAQESLKYNKNKEESHNSSKEKTSKSSHNIKALDDFMKVAITNLDLDTVLKNMIDHIMRVTEADRGFVVLINEEGELYSHVMRARRESEEGKSDLLKNFSRSITKRVLESKNSILLNDIMDDKDLAAAQSIAGLDIRSAVCVPLKSDNDIIGLIYLDRQSFVGAFTEDDLTLVESLANYASIAVVNAKQHLGIQKKLETTQEQLIQSEKMATIGTLAGGVAHEINTPLGAILNNAELLMMEEVPEDVRESLDIIKQSTLKCKTIVEQLLKYSRKTSDDFEPANINSIINDVCIILENQLKSDDVLLKKTLNDLPTLKANPTEISQVFTNLLLNARDAIIERKSISNDTGIIKINTEQSDGFVKIIISDNGCGIPEQNFNKLFDPFFTTKEVGKGTGLGLSIVHKIIERHGGRVEFHSEVNKGTTITITLLV